MTETNERAEGADDGQTQREGGVQPKDEGELRAEEESAKAMEAEVPHPADYPDPGQEQPS
jgi:hypothetical protein